MQNALFPDDNNDATPEKHPAPRRAPAGRAKAGSGDRVEAATPTPEVTALARRLPPTLRLGTSSWSFPGWTGLVWDRDYPQATLARDGLAAYARHPLLRTVSLDRAFYRPLTAAQYARYAAQVPDDFRFVVKAPSVVADALVRGDGGQGLQPNPAFLDAELAGAGFLQPVTEGLGAKAGALVFQLSPLPASLLAGRTEVLDRLHALLRRLHPAWLALRAAAPDAVLAVEVRDTALLGPELAHLLRDTGATYCLGGHARLPALENQLPMLRALWPGPLVCRWNLNRRHGAFGYEDARGLYEPFNRLVDEDLPTRATLARVIRATTGHTLAGRALPAYITINNKAEGSAPRSVEALAAAVLGEPPASVAMT
jgi:uncharacterized protein YecE (DUF72 family)